MRESFKKKSMLKAFFFFLILTERRTNKSVAKGRPVAHQYAFACVFACRRLGADQKRGGQRAEGDLAHLQAHQADEENRPLQSPQTPTEVPAGNSPVRALTSNTHPLSHTHTHKCAR